MSLPQRRPSLPFASPGSGTRVAVRRPRDAERCAIELVVVIQTEDNAPLRGLSRDIGIGGMFIRTETPIAYGSSVVLKITLPTRASPLELTGVVRWMSDDGMGIQFDSMGALETYEITKLVGRASEP
jgi:uncharacterized protein (TIGR02266 family)